MTGETKKGDIVHYVVNPHGAAGSAKRKWKRAEKYLRSVGASYAVHYSTLEHGIPDIVRELSEQGTPQDPVYIAVVGGDGSLNEAANGMTDPSSVIFGFIPAGSGNDLARDLEIGKLPLTDLLDRIQSRRVQRSMDVGQVTFFDEWTDPAGQSFAPGTKRFLVSSGIGFDAAICAYVERSKLKNILNHLGIGKLIYIIEAIRLILATKKTDYRIICGEEKRYAHCLFACAMNHRYEGGGFMFGPGAGYDDGILDLCTADPVHNISFFHIFPTAYKGNHVRYSCVHTGASPVIEVRTAEPQWVHTDGEPQRQSCAIRWDILPARLRCMV